MKTIIRRLSVLLLCVLVLAGLGITAAAQEDAATDLRGQITVKGYGYDSFRFLTDGKLTSYKTSSGSCTLKLESPEANIASLYLMFNREYGEYTITDNDSGATMTAGTYNFLHEYLDLTAAFGGPVRSISIQFDNGAVRLSEICAFTEGTLPDFVQQWEPPLDSGADIMLLSTHGDDDQLFFAGLFPLYAAERGYQVQVIYLTNHRNRTHQRAHEMLNGMWATGVKYYPVFGEFPDDYSEDIDVAYKKFAQGGYSKDDLLQFMVEQLRRFKPQVVVGHDFKGEYGHGMHMVYTDILVKSLDLANDASVYPELADQYGLWDVPKTYVHLYEENPIVIDYDVPLDAFDGMTAFMATQTYGYPCHESQQYTWFTDWLNGENEPITKATQIKSYNPCNFGLYRSTVGEDILKNDFMENITSYAEQARLEAERLEQERLEAERLEQERLEAERLEQERLEAERVEKERLEAERLENERLEKERMEQEAQKKAFKVKVLLGALLLIAMILCLIVIILLARSNRKYRHGKFSKKR